MRFGLVLYKITLRDTPYTLRQEKYKNITIAGIIQNDIK